MPVTECYVCEAEIDVQTEQWWQYRWEEHPSEADVEEAIEDPDFRDWFVENQVVCTGCHADVQAEIEEMRA